MKKFYYISISLLLFWTLPFHLLAQHELPRFALKTNLTTPLFGIYELTAEVRLNKRFSLEASIFDYKESSLIKFFWHQEYFGGHYYEGGVKYHLINENQGRAFQYLKLSYRYGERGGHTSYYENKGMKFSYDQQRFENGMKFIYGVTFKLPLLLIEPYSGLGYNHLNVQTSNLTSQYNITQENMKDYYRKSSGHYSRLTFHIGIKIGLHTSLK